MIQPILDRDFVPAVYFNRKIGYYGLELDRLTDYLFWFALPESSFPPMCWRR